MTTRFSASTRNACIAAVTFLELRPSGRLVLMAMLRYVVDDSGRCDDVTPRQLAARIPRSTKRPRYSEVMVLRALRDLRAAGLIDWERIMPEGCEVGGRRVTFPGGRAFRVNVAALTSPARRGPRGTSR